ncbi:chromosomal replication initiator protein DnaA [Sulfurimonas sp. MAG313]|nr:chromosomal replication initiator protein DnaA [Sulfurimonas sp. MAG313]MDF1880855.1 chromosomal replication initiator protein DnaA [Sulfurimonas sp. MAG313]
MTIGDSILVQLKEEIPEIEYKRYIKQLSFCTESSKTDYALFLAPNPLIASWVRTKYSEKIAHLFEVKTSVKPQVAIELKNKRPLKAQSKDSVTSTSPQHSAHQSLLNPAYTFDNYVVGTSNQFAFSAAQSVCEKPGEAYNPLYIYGGVGLGKTHLMQAVGNRLQTLGKSVIYSSVEQFVNDFTRHLRNQTMDRFKDKYRNCDVLMIDDIQFLSGKVQTQEEFFHTFETLRNENKQIILTSDKHPKQIAGLEDRLKSRFEWGLVADIQAPELETKIAIINKKCEINRVNITKDVIDYIATIIDNNAREIEGILSKLHAYAKLMNQEITLEFTKNVLKEHIKEQRENITIDDIVKFVCKELNVKPSEIRSKNRSKNIVYARRVSIYLARSITQNTMPQLAQYFGMKDHTTISHTMKKINELLKSDENFKLKIDELNNKISAGQTP